MEKEIYEAKQEAKVARLAASATGDTRVRTEEDLTRSSSDGRGGQA